MRSALPWLLVVAACRAEQPDPGAPSTSGSGAPSAAGSPSGAAPGASSTPATGASPGAAPPTLAPSTLRFTDATAGARLAFTRRTGRSGRLYYPEQHGGGAAVLDADGDGWPDLFLVDGGPLPGADVPATAHRLFLNARDGTFREAAAGAVPAAAGYGLGVAAADVDADRRPDLLVLNHGSLQLLRNTGGAFADVTAASGLRGPGWNAGAAFLDADRDGLLDLFVVRYVAWSVESNPVCHLRDVRYACGPYMFEPEADRFFLGRAGARFEDASKAWHLHRSAGRGLGVTAADFDDDGRPEVYVANDEEPNALYRVVEGAFVDEGFTRGAAVSANGLVRAGMGVDAADYDGDGRLDVAVTNFQDEPLTLYRNLGPGGFEDVSTRAGLGATARTLGFGVVFADFDNDGWLDLFVANGHVWENVAQLQPGVEHAQRDQLFRNRGDGTFEDVSAALEAQAGVSRGAVAVDHDRDGDLDLVVVRLDAPSVLLRNEDAGGNGWIELRLEGREPNTEAIGARVRVEAGGRAQVREVWRARSFASAADTTLHVGLGRADRVDAIEVRWPSGETSRATGLDPRRRYVWRYGEARPEPIASKP